MGCERTPDTIEIDLPALKQTYRRERDKRLRPEGEEQYVEVSDDYAEYVEVDPWSPPTVRDPLSIETDVAVLGGGIGGLMAGVNLRQAGVDDFRIIDVAGDFGGTWYWNRYPGVQCDIESYCYIPRLEEPPYIPKHKYSYGGEIYEHCQRIGRHFGLYEKAIFGTNVRALRWDEKIDRWRIETDRGDDIRARFLIMAAGSYNRPKLPGVPGIKRFKGRTFHTSRWDYDYTGGDSDGGLTRLADKRVAIIGTGASAIQAIPHLGRHAKQLYVFQRTPSAVGVRGNHPTDPEWARSLEPGWQLRRQHSFTDALTSLPSGTEDLVCDGWTDINHALREQFAALGRGEITREQLGAAYEREDFRHQDKIRRRVDDVIQDKATAEKLKAWYMFWCKRPTFHDEYLPTFNRDNVTLVDVSASKGVDRITETGIVANGVEYEVDCIIFATGFEITTDLKRVLGISTIEGRDGQSLFEHWKDRVTTLHGFMTNGFPNQFFTGYLQGGIWGGTTLLLDKQTQHMAQVIAQALGRGLTSLEPTQAAVDAYQVFMDENSVDNSAFREACTPGYYNNEGGSVKRSHVGEVYAPGPHAFEAMLKGWREKGDMEGMLLGD